MAQTKTRGGKAAQDRAQREDKATQAEFDKQADARAKAREAKAAEASTADAATEATAKKARPVTEFAAPERVDDVPEIARGNGSSTGTRQRSQRWVKQLQPVVDDPGAWYKVAEFNASSTAGTQSSALRVSARQMAAGEDPKLLLPEFDTDKYELKVLKRGLAIYARLEARTAEGDATEAEAEGDATTEKAEA